MCRKDDYIEMIYFTVIFFWARNINKKKSIRLLLRAFFFLFMKRSRTVFFCKQRVNDFLYVTH